MVRAPDDKDFPYWPQTNNAIYKEVWITSAKAYNLIIRSLNINIYKYLQYEKDILYTVYRYDCHELLTEKSS